MTTTVAKDDFAAIAQVARWLIRAWPWITGAFGVVAGLLVAAAWYLISQVHDVDKRMTALSALFDRHVEWHNGKAGSEAPTIPSSDVQHPPPQPSGSQPQEITPAPSGAPVPAESVGRRTAPPPDLAKVRTGAPICVDPQTSRPFSCDQVSSCYPEGYWKPDLVSAIREKYPDSTVTLCEPVK